MLYLDPFGVQGLVKEKGLFVLTSMAAITAAVSEKSTTYAEKSKNSKPRLLVNGRDKVSPAAIFPSAKRIQISQFHRLRGS